MPPPREGMVAGESDVYVILTRAMHRATNQKVRRLIAAGDLLRLRWGNKAPPRHTPVELSGAFDHDSGRSLWPEPILAYALSLQPLVESELLTAVRTCLAPVR